MNATVAGIVIEAPKPKMSRDQKLMTKMVIADQYYNGKEVTQYVIAMAFDKNAKYINNYVKKGGCRLSNRTNDQSTLYAGKWTKPVLLVL